MRGHKVIHAPAGAGKTYHITNEVQRLVDSGVNKDRIFCVTFTNRAKANMKERVGDNAIINTFHGLLLSNLSEKGYSLIDDYTRDYILSSLIEITGCVASRTVIDREVEYIRNMAFFQTQGKSYEDYVDFVTSEQLEALYVTKRSSENKRLNVEVLSQFCKITRLYYKAIGDFNMDFLEVLILGYFKVRLEIDYIFVDEFQDTTFTEMKSVLSLNNRMNITLLCDANQSIYGWKGANVQYNLKYFKHFYKPQEMWLNKIYRSNQKIVDVGNILLDDNVGQSALETDSTIKALEFDSAAEQIHYICKNARADLKEGKTVSILARTNDAVQECVKELNLLGIPSFYRSMKDKSEYKLFSIYGALLKLSLNQFDDNTFRSLCNDKLLIDCLGGQSLNEFNRSSKVFNKIPASLCIHGEEYLNGLLNHTKNIVVFDLETTGLDFFEDRIVQLAAIKLGPNLQPIDKIDILVNCGKSVGDSEKVHKFSDEYLQQNGVSTKECLDKFLKFSSGCILCGHNINYDVTMLRTELDRHALKFPFKRKDIYDTLSLSRSMYKLKSYKLENLNTELLLGCNPNHNAFDDVYATCELLRTLVHKLSKNKSEIMKFVNGIASLRIVELVKKVFNDFEVSRDFNGHMYFRYYCREYFIPEIFIEQFDRIVKIYKLPSTVNLKFTDYLKYSTEINMQDSSRYDDSAVNALTIHQSKGLEFDSVYIISPASRSNSGVTEETRVQYVALTRAKSSICVTCTKESANSSIYKACKEVE